MEFKNLECFCNNYCHGVVKIQSHHSGSVCALGEIIVYVWSVRHFEHSEEAEEIAIRRSRRDKERKSC